MMGSAQEVGGGFSMNSRNYAELFPIIEWSDGDDTVMESSANVNGGNFVGAPRGGVGKNSTPAISTPFAGASQPVLSRAKATKSLASYLEEEGDRSEPSLEDIRGSSESPTDPASSQEEEAPWGHFVTMDSTAHQQARVVNRDLIIHHHLEASHCAAEKRRRETKRAMQGFGSSYSITPGLVTTGRNMSVSTGLSALCI